MNIHDKDLVDRFINAKKGERIGVKCPDCGAEMIVREGYSKFLGCSAYPKCKAKYALAGGNSKVMHPKIISSAFEYEEIYNENIGYILCADDM